MKRSTYLLIFLVILSFSACIMRFPEIYKDDYEFGSYRIILHVNPEDAHVLLNGRFVGEAYEFSTYESALKLRSTANSLVIKKKGFVEEEIDLSDYHQRKIEINLALKTDPYFYTEKVGRKPPAPLKPVKESDRKYKVLKEKKIPNEVPDVPKVTDFATIDLTVKPAESSIYLDGKFWGVSPDEGKITNFNLEKGKHKIEVVKPGYKTATKSVTILKNRKIKISIVLEKR